MTWKLSEIRISKGEEYIEASRHLCPYQRWYWRASWDGFFYTDGFAKTVISALIRGLRDLKAHHKENAK